MKNPPNIVLLSVDALRADHLSWYGYHRTTSPFLDSLAESEVVFTHAYSPSTHTREAVPALLTGHRPPAHAASGYRLTGTSIAERLADAGYATGGFHSNPYASKAYGFDDGFHEFNDDLLLGGNRLTALAQRALEKFIFKRGEYYARADEINRRGLAWLDDQREPFFLWMHYMDVHGPYVPPAEARKFSDPIDSSEAESLYQRCVKNPEAITEEEHQQLIDTYDDEIRYCDAQIEQLFAELDDRGLREDTIVVITADHGDAFAEHGYYGHPRQVHDELLSVPLIIVHPEATDDRIEQPVSLLDLVPSIAASADVQDVDIPGSPLFDADGVAVQRTGPVLSSVAGQDEEAGHRRFAAYTEEWTATVHRDADGSLIDISLADISGGTYEPADAPEEGRQLVALLRDHVRLTDEERAPVEEDEQSAEVKRRLEALGYK